MSCFWFLLHVVSAVEAMAVFRTHVGKERPVFVFFNLTPIFLELFLIFFLSFPHASVHFSASFTSLVSLCAPVMSPVKAPL